MKNNIQKAAYVLIAIATCAMAFFGAATVASAQYYDGYTFGDYGYEDPYSYYDTSYYDPYDGYYDQPYDWNSYGDWDYYGDTEYAYYNNDWYDYNYGGYDDDYYYNDYGYNDSCYYNDCYGYDYDYYYPTYQGCGSACSTGQETIIDIWTNNVNTNTNIQYADNDDHDHDDHDHDDDDNDDEDFEVMCKPDDRTVEEGDRVRWIAEVDGVDEDDVDFTWSGDADGDDQEVTERYNRSGTYEAKVRARYNGQTETDTCTVRVTDEDDNDDDDNNVTLVSNPPTGTPASGVYLSQVPYTGAADNLKLIGFITMLTLSSLAGAYYIVTRKARGDRKAFIERFKQDNIASKA